MARSAAEYLTALEPRRRPELPDTTTGTLRLDARENGRTEHWYLTVADQHVEVSRSAEDADVVIRADRAVFDRLAAGDTHISSALLRNDVTVQGNLRLMPLLRRIFPGPATARHPRELGRRAAPRRPGGQEDRR
ncbi:SCP2 sterol-binding domain-containing protein [Micromonospora costi]|uniref:Sterol-binding protein n=1 Tax=Micromonospora costi TaxID=1530042 RepID=A0A3B0ACM9_9ACTN|nr:SCP2 sterol-binding domain-containing protein [Micromonospora costi]RKN57457.1 sterol-binding protein [Micromonospora costi]